MSEDKKHTPLPKSLPAELLMRLEDSGIDPDNATWADILYQCECGLDLIYEDQDFYSPQEQRQFKAMFDRWSKKAKKAIAKAEGK